jgi:nucleoside-diphosphate-sugar epimerase
MPSTVVIFGGDTDPGYRLAQLASAAHWRVVSVLRSRIAVPFLKRIGAETAYADATERAEVDAIFAGRDGADLAVVCLLGGSPQINTQGNLNVIDAAAAAGVKRFVLTTSIGCGDSAGAIDPFVKAIAGRSIRAKEWAENQLRSTSMDWTIVRAGGTTRRVGTGGAILVDSNAVSGHINLSDLGDMLFLALQSPKSIHRALAAVDRGRAYSTNGNPVVPAEL